MIMRSPSMLVKLKADVRVRGLSNEILLAILIAQSVYAETEDSMVITSLTDGDHKAGSKHNCGDAMDLRLPARATSGNMAQRLANALGKDYDVVLEGDHIHVEYDPK